MATARPPARVVHSPGRLTRFDTTTRRPAPFSIRRAWFPVLACRISSPFPPMGGTRRPANWFPPALAAPEGFLPAAAQPHGADDQPDHRVGLRQVAPQFAGAGCNVFRQQPD